jgi:hypothetical protein
MKKLKNILGLLHGGVDMVSVEWLNQVHNTKSIFHISKTEILTL